MATVVAVLVAILAIVLVLCLGKEENNKGFRTIRVSDIVGDATVMHETKEYAAYKDMKLQEGYTLATDTDSYVRMMLDEDKYIRVEEDSKVSFETLGQSANGRTVIRLEYGVITNEVTKALREDEEYIINTPNTVLAIKGTFFRVAADIDESGDVNVDVYTYGGVVQCKRILPDGKIVDEDTLLAAGYKTKVSMTAEDTIYQVENAVDDNKTKALLSVTEIPDADIVDMYVASVNGHEMFLSTEEVWDVIKERDIDITNYTSNRDGKAILPLDGGEHTSESTEDANIETDIDLEEARLWLYDTKDLYEADGTVKWNEGLTRYSKEYDKLSEAVTSAIALYQAHGYSYAGDESDITSLTEARFKKQGEMFFKLELTDKALLYELEKGILNGYVEAGKTLPEGDEYEALLKQVRERIKEFTTLGLRISYWDNQYSVWIYGEFRFDGAQLVRFTENMEWCPRWLIYNEEDKIWELDW